MTQLHEGVDIEQAKEATAWDLKVADELATTDPPSDEELRALRGLLDTQKAAAEDGRSPAVHASQDGESSNQTAGLDAPRR
jgi:hypothetical protein